MTSRRQVLATLASLPLINSLWPLSAQEPESHAAIPISGTAAPEFAPLDDLMTGLLTEHPEVAGGALALGHRGQVLYSRGFGLAQRHPDKPVQPDSFFRIASISKPITAVAVLTLIEKGKLALDAKVHELLALGPPVDARFQQVTVRQLLQHTGGWDRGVSFDPMFRSVLIAKDQQVPPPAMPEQIARYMLQQKLDFDPGTKYAYSNFGYSMLGLVVARLSGQSYGEYVQQAVLNPLKLHDLKLGKTLRADRAEREVSYYEVPARTGPAVMGPDLGKPVPLPYGAWCLEAMDAHGGWLATAPDLVKFAMALDDPEKCPILSAKSIAAMFARPEGPPGLDDQGRPLDVWYGCGWSVRTAGKRGVNTWHNGRLSGTSTILVRRHDGFDWAVLFNSDATNEGKALSGLIDGKVHGAVDRVKKNLGLS